MVGIYRQDIKGKIYENDDDPLEYLINAIAVVTEEHSFIIPIDYGSHISSYLSAEWADSTVALTYEKALNDYNGYSNTQRIIASTDWSVAQSCANSVFGDGTNGHLGSAGEWAIVMENFERITNLFKKLGYNGLNETLTYHTSTLGDVNNYWVCDMKNRELKLVEIYSDPNSLEGPANNYYYPFGELLL